MCIYLSSLEKNKTLKWHFSSTIRWTTIAKVTWGMKTTMECQHTLKGEIWMRWWFGNWVKKTSKAEIPLPSTGGHFEKQARLLRTALGKLRSQRQQKKAGVGLIILKRNSAHVCIWDSLTPRFTSSQAQARQLLPHKPKDKQFKWRWDKKGSRCRESLYSGKQSWDVIHSLSKYVIKVDQCLLKFTYPKLSSTNPHQTCSLHGPPGLSQCSSGCSDQKQANKKTWVLYVFRNQSIKKSC